MTPETANGASAVEAVDVVKTYETDDLKVHALRGISIRVPRGDMVAIMGPSGCGKTTLLNCLSGLDDIDNGVVRVGGVDISQLSDNDRSSFRARKMGFVFQFYNLLPVLSSVENVELPLLVSGVQAKEARERAREALALVHLEAWANHRPSQLSGGQRQRVTIARALVNKPDIVWADEPTGDLDSKNARRDHGPHAAAQPGQWADIRHRHARRQHRSANVPHCQHARRRDHQRGGAGGGA